MSPHLVQPAPAAPVQSTGSTTAVQEVDTSVVDTLQAENAKLKEQLARALHMNDRIWQELVEKKLSNGTT